MTANDEAVLKIFNSPPQPESWRVDLLDLRDLRSEDPGSEEEDCEIRGEDVMDWEVAFAAAQVGKEVWCARDDDGYYFFVAMAAR